MIIEITYIAMIGRNYQFTNIIVLFATKGRLKNILKRTIDNSLFQ